MDAPPAALLLIAHGSRHEPANADLRLLAGRLAAAGPYPIVEPAFLELAGPTIAEAGARLVDRGARRVLMVPYFLAAGVHLIRDLTAARDALRAEFPAVAFHLGPALGPHPLLDRLVAERAAEVDREGDAPAYDDARRIAPRYEPLGGHG